MILKEHQIQEKQALETRGKQYNVWRIQHRNVIKLSSDENQNA